MAHDDFTDEFDAMFADMARRSSGDRYAPNVDVFTDAENSRVVLYVEVAGADRESLTVAADDRSLYLAGRREPPRSDEAPCCALKEIEYGDFERKVRLPFTIDHERTRAEYEDGVLRIELQALRREVPAVLRTEIRLVFRRTSR